ncbi:MAG TPA: HlyD family efflux transporter periplasmic adaptor subunit [Roseiflexaceae bacterium]|nr:HlyD family efflux transporter periplasmic adaptor subunit [Roseiflexaceae bacterium]
MSLSRSLIAALLILPLLVGCGGAATAQQEPPTPTPLPPDPAVERPTYTVERGLIESDFTTIGTVTPVDLVRLSFKRTGRVALVSVQRGDRVTAGAVIMELQQDEKLEELRSAQDAVVSAQRDLENAQKAKDKKVKQAELQLQNAREDLARLLPGGPDDPISKAQDALEEAQNTASDQRDTGSEAKTGAEYALLQAAEALQDAQKARDEAFWNNDWAQRYGTDPKTPCVVNADGVCVPNKLTDEQKEAYAEALITADRTLRDAERAVEQRNRDLEKARTDEIEKNGDADEKVQEAQTALNDLLRGKGNKELTDAQRGVEEALLGVEEARQETFNSQLKAVDDARRRVDKAQKDVEAGRIIAPQDGEILSVGVSEGDNAEEFNPVVELADPSQLEIGAELGAEQMRQLSEGQAVEINPLGREDVIMPAIIRRLPAPYGSGGSGAVEEQDRTTRFNVLDAKGQTLEAGNKVRIRIVLERKEDALWLPKDAVRSFEGRRFVLVRSGQTERRVTVRIGIETEDRYEILEGIEEGDVVVGP